MGLAMGALKLGAGIGSLGMSPTAAMSGLGGIMTSGPGFGAAGGATGVSGATGFGSSIGVPTYRF